MENKLSKQSIIVLLTVIVALAFWAGTKYAQWRLLTIPIEIVADNEIEEKANYQKGNMSEKPSDVVKIKVHIAGAVENPGVFELSEGARLEDILEIARPKKEALIDEYLNRAKVLIDGEKIIVPTEGEEELIIAETINGKAPIINERVNINNASKEQLETLEGIGPSKAQAIIDYRENWGGFKSIEEITNVKGIGQATFEKIKSRITIR